MPRPAKEQLEAFWDFADKNGDGKLCIKEFKEAVTHYHQMGNKSECAPPSDRQLAELFTSLNDNNDEYLSKAEYLNHVDKNERSAENLRKGFFDMDKDGKGTISKEELTEVMLKNGFTESQATEVMKECDLDGDGKINIEEFMAAL